MKKIKKIFAVLVSLAMVLGMSMTTFATDPQTGSIKVNGLTKENTTVKLYQIVSWDEDNSTWVAADWAKEYVDLTQDPVSIDWETLADLTEAEGTTITPDEQTTTATGSIEFTGLGMGGYMLTAAGDTTEYNVMGTLTYQYDETSKLMVPKASEISAKGDTYSVVKTFANGDDAFVARGDEIVFNIDTVFPSYPDSETNRTFTITDTPSGLKIKNIVVTVGGVDNVLTAGTDYTLTPAVPAGDDEAVTVSFSPEYIGMGNEHAAAAVQVQVTAEVTGDGDYSNEATTSKASTPSKVEGQTGSITINKFDEKNNVLAGAEFSISQNGTALQFVATGTTGEYRLANATEIADTTITKVTDVIATNGVVTVKGLDEGTYEIAETKAPDGYSIVEVPDVTIVAGSDSTVHVTTDVHDTTLSALPSTGGIGTTIFTIGGCLIMIIAAALFFASRKKSSK